MSVAFSQKEIEFLNKMEECRIATSHDNMPHVKPVSYLYEDGIIFIATDYDTRMYKNLLNNPNAALAIDIYKDKVHKAVCMQGKVIIIENGKEFVKLYKKFHDRFEWVRNQPWDENEAPFIKIVPFRKSSWGLE
ncbi:MAG: pyridoxamine 5'-phosphate oxidase family protein [Nitrosopumilaceae archaeon]